MKPQLSHGSLRSGAFLAALLMFVSGCGFVLSKGPPRGHETTDYFTCTESNTGPILDIVWGGLNVLGAVIAAAEPDPYGDRGPAVAVGLGWGVLSGFSAASGFKKSEQCRTAKKQLAERLRLGRPVVPAVVTVVQSVVITPAADTLATGGTRQLVASAHDSSGAGIPGRAFVWSSSNDAIASVSAAGLVTAHAVGTVIIAANTSGSVGTARIVVGAAR